MTTGERVREVRKSKNINLTMEKFGEALGVGKTAISKIEGDERALTDQMAKAICRTYGVNEEWLRTGEGDMFVEIDRNARLARMVDEVLADRDESFRKRLLSAIVSLTPDQLVAVEEFCEKLFAGQDTTESDIIDVDRELEDYKRQLLAEKSPEDGSSQSLA